MQIELKYSINSEEIDDMYKLRRIMKSDDLTFVLFEIINNLKKKSEYSYDEKVKKDKSICILDVFYEELQNVLIEHDVNINELIC